MKFFKIIILSFLIGQLPAQNLNDEQWNVTSAAGEEYAVGNNQLAWVLGEMMVESYTAGNKHLSQGFLQEYSRIVPNEDVESTVSISIYPNPFIEVINIKTNSDQSLILRISNLLGKQVHNTKLSTSTTQLDMSQLIPGSYMLSIYTEDNFLLESFKVNKSK